jgi:hypothetical protein
MTSDLYADREFLACEAARPLTGSHHWLPDQPPSPWRSLGKKLNYSNWEDRDRFIELDAAIMVRDEMELRSRQIRSTVQRKLDHIAWTDEQSFLPAA